jgi:hypothetical protein
VASAVVILGGGAAALAFTPPGRQLLERAGLAAVTDSAADPATTVSDTGGTADTTARVVQAPPADTPVSNPPRQQTPPARPLVTAPVTRNPAPTVPQTGFLTIDATPSGNVFVDGREIDYTPQIKLELAAGEHLVEVRREGYKPYRERILITVGNETRKSVQLQPEGS